MKKKQPPQLNGLSGSLTHFYQLGALLLRKGVKCHSPIQQLFSAYSSFVFFLFIYLFIYFFSCTMYMYLFGYDFNNLKQRQAEYFFFIEILTSVLTIQSYLFLSLNFFLNSYLPSNYFNVSIFRWSMCHFYEIIRLLLFIQRFIFPAKTFRGKIFGAHLGFSLQVIHS